MGDIAHRAGAVIHELRTLDTDLEALYFRLTTAPDNRNRNLNDATVATAPPERAAFAGHDGGNQR